MSQVVPKSNRARMPTVLLVGPNPPRPHVGGVEKGVDLLLRSKLAEETRMQLFNNYRRPDPARHLAERIFYQARMVRAFCRSINRAKPELIHVKTSIGVNFHQNAIYARVGLVKGLPVVIQIHDGRFEGFYASSPKGIRYWIRSTLERVDRVVVLSKYWESSMKRIAPRARFTIVPNGVGDLETPNNYQAGRRGSNLVLFMGTGEEATTRDKGFEDLLEVLQMLVPEMPDSRWVLAGLPSPAAVLERVKACGLKGPCDTGQIRLMGVIDEASRLQLLLESSILAMPSYYENMPNLLLEAMAAGLGVVATRVGAIPEMLGAEGGCLFQAGDRRQLKESLSHLLSNPELVKSQGDRNQRVVQREYSMSVVEEKLATLYRDVMQITSLGRSGKRDSLPKSHPSFGPS